MVIDPNMKKTFIKAYATYQNFLAEKKDKAAKKRENKLKASVLLLKKKRKQKELQN